jgi:hypothetical protein
MNVDATVTAVRSSGSQPQGVVRDEAPLLSSAREAVAPEPAQAQSGGSQLKDISFNITQPGGSSVQLRMVERAGELRVAVHTTSHDLNQDLRAELPDLTKKLSDTGFHSELWRPAAHAAMASGDTSAAKNQGGNPDGADSRHGSGGSQQGRRQQDQNHSQSPKWVEEFENGTQSAPIPTGDIHGFSN